MTWSGDHYKYIEHFIKNNYGYQLTLCTYPVVRFINRDSGKEISRNINDLHKEYNIAKKEERVEKDRINRIKKRKKRENLWGVKYS